jgi:hypothetical protein
MVLCCAWTGALAPKARNAMEAITAKLVLLSIQILLLSFQFRQALQAIQKQQRVPEIP